MRTKEGRAALLGVDCPDCRAFYENDNLSAEALEKVLQACSKHRVAHRPSRSGSPQHPWDLNFRDEGQMAETPGSPLKTRKRRKMLSQVLANYRGSVQGGLFGHGKGFVENLGYVPQAGGLLL